MNLFRSSFYPIKTDNKKTDLRLPETIGLPTWKDRLNHMKAIGFSPNVIFDCGAFIGSWAASVAEIFPDSKIVLIEPNTDILGEIKKITNPFKNRTTIVNAAVSDKS